MDNLEQAARQALEALKKYCTPYQDGTHPADESITALQQALDYIANVSNMVEQPNRKPLGSVAYIPCCNDKSCSKCKAAEPPAREWQGLTDEELPDDATYEFNCGVRWAENKLKEKNT